MRSETWRWSGPPAIDVAYSVAGAGPDMLLLPSFSTVSTREEMAPLAAGLAGEFRTIVPDWPGFGRGRHQRLEQTPALHLAFLEAFTRHVAAGPVSVVAAGHAAGYVLRLARTGLWSRIVLVAPTWRGPLPTMMQRYHPMQDWLQAAIRLPGLGHALYRLNVARPVIAAMYRRHVYADAGRLTPEVLAAKTAVARRAGGRFGSGAFVTGGLDVVRDRAEFLALAGADTPPVMLIYGANTPPKSRAEMVALAGLASVESHPLESGALGVHEERAEQVAPLIARFCHC